MNLDTILRRFGGTRSEAEEQRARVLYYVHRSTLARIASRFPVYATTDAFLQKRLDWTGPSIRFDS